MLESTDPWALVRSIPQSQTVSADEISLWSVALDQPTAVVSELRRLLAPNECLRAERYFLERDKRRFIVARGTMRLILGTLIGSDPERLVIEYGAEGKPSLAESSLNFNLSHAHEQTVLAVAWQREIGVDIEFIRPVQDMQQIARKYFSPNEYASLLSLPPSERLIAFFKCWSRKEAFIKALGKGLTFPLDQFDVSLKPDEPARLIAVRNEIMAANRWSVRDITRGSAYVGR